MSIQSGDFQCVRVGKYTICRGPDEKGIWIQAEDGDGGEFSEESFEAVVDVFYRENF